MLKTISNNSLVYSKSLREIFNTHPKLNINNETRECVNYAMTIILNTLNHDEKDNNKLEFFYRFLLYSNLETVVGKFCFTFNDFLDSSILTRNSETLKNIIQKIEATAFFELYDNKLLNDSEKDIIKNIINFESNLISETFKESLVASWNLDSNIFNTDNSIFNKLYKSKIINYEFKNLYNTLKFNPKIQISLNNEYISTLFFFNLRLLSLNLAKGKINYITQTEFSEQIYIELCKKYEICIKFVNRYHKGLIKEGKNI